MHISVWQYVYIFGNDRQRAAWTLNLEHHTHDVRHQRSRVQLPHEYVNIATLQKPALAFSMQLSLRV